MADLEDVQRLAATLPDVLLHLENADEADLREALEDPWLVHASAEIAERYLEQRER